MKLKQYIISIFAFILLAGLSKSLFAAEIIFKTPSGGFTTKRIVVISGEINNYNRNRAMLVLNGIPQTIPLANNQFSINTVIAPGLNLVEIKAGKSSKKLSFYAKVPMRDVKVLLTWDTPTDVDLWVIDPKGEKCYFGHKTTSSGGNLDIDITSGYGPETFTMAKALPGNYSVQVQYYSSGSAPVTRVNLYVVLYEGTPREKRQHFTFVMTKAHQVYQIGNFNIENIE